MTPTQLRILHISSIDASLIVKRLLQPPISDDGAAILRRVYQSLQIQQLATLAALRCVADSQ